MSENCVPPSLVQEKQYIHTVLINWEQFDWECQKPSDLKGTDQHLGALREMPEQWEVCLNTWILKDRVGHISSGIG